MNFLGLPRGIGKLFQRLWTASLKLFKQYRAAAGASTSSGASENDLPETTLPLGPALPGAPTTAEIDATMAYAEAENALATRAAYASDWRDFAAWCAGKGATPLPAHPGMAAAYLSALTEAGLKASTISRRAAAIGHRHKLAGH
jgi:hypothetical protein